MVEHVEKQLYCLGNPTIQLAEQAEKEANLRALHPVYERYSRDKSVKSDLRALLQR